VNDEGAVLHSHSPAATQAFGSAVGEVLRPGDVLILEGPLGAGKTCLVRGIVGGAGGDAAAVRSPTFVIHQPHQGHSVTVHHVDLYRLGPGAAIDVLDLDTALIDGAAVIEWGAYADLDVFAPFTVSISGDGEHDEHRLLRLSVPAPAHIARAWGALLAAGADP
jgi:tRNA threonylcarbamoyl adenosine modification protein YjeE